jgi:glyoxylase-like metal-dependent hydrolase (beta-lactamase superfamily II)
MLTDQLSIDVYVAPMRPYTSPDQLGEGEVATWAPSSSTLIFGATEGIIIDALLTFENADQIAAWATSFGKKITGVYITHGHGDHWLGLARLLEHFPEARGYSAREVVARAAWEADINKTTKYWTSRFPGELPETPVVPEVLNSDEILVNGQVVNLIHVGQGDIDGSTIFHVPSADAVVAGDVVYNNVHMMFYEADAAKREAWIASIDAVAALNPKLVIAGHKSVGRPTCRRTPSRSVSSTCATLPPSRRRAARWRTWSTACSTCTASATSRIPCGSRHEPKSLAVA